MIRINKPSDDLERWAKGIDRLMSSMFVYESFGTPSTWRPPTDVYETSGRVVIKIEIAGMNPDDFQISFDERILQIRGVRRDKQHKLSYHCLEIQYGEFLSEVYLPGHYEQDAIQAQYENGFLTITLPKLEPDAPRHITVGSDE